MESSASGAVIGDKRNSGPRSNLCLRRDGRCEIGGAFSMCAVPVFRRDPELVEVEGGLARSILSYHLI